MARRPGLLTPRRQADVSVGSFGLGSHSQKSSSPVVTVVLLIVVRRSYLTSSVGVFVKNGRESRALTCACLLVPFLSCRVQFCSSAIVTAIQASGPSPVLGNSRVVGMKTGQGTGSEDMRSDLLTGLLASTRLVWLIWITPLGILGRCSM